MFDSIKGESQKLYWDKFNTLAVIAVLEQNAIKILDYILEFVFST